MQEGKTNPWARLHDHIRKKLNEITQIVDTSLQEFVETNNLTENDIKNHLERKVFPKENHKEIFSYRNDPIIAVIKTDTNIEILEIWKAHKK